LPRRASLAPAAMREAFHHDPAKAQAEYVGRRFRVRFRFDQTGDGGAGAGR